MQFNRTKNAKRNMAFGVILKIYTLAVPFFIRTLFLYIMGVEYLGLGSLFTSILSVLSLAELGVGSAMVYSMYKPLAEDDTETVCALMQLYKIYYRIIGSVILIAGLAVMPFLPYLIKSDLPADINLYVLYLLNLFSTVVSYWLFAYKNCIIGANQRGDISTKISLCITTLNYILQILVLVLFHNYYLYIITGIVTGIISNFTTAIIADKMFPQFKAHGKLPKETVKAINGRVRDLFTAKIGTVIVYSADTLVISAFLGLTVLAQYQNYYYLFTAVAGFVEIVFGSLTAIVGNSIVSESYEKNYRDFKIFMLIIAWIAGFCSTCFLCLYQPFMELWVGEELMFEFGIVICFCIYFFVYEINRLLLFYKDASGMWHSDRLRPFVVSISNLIINIISVNFIGIYGIILSTVISTVLIGYPWLVRNLGHEIFQPKDIKSIFLKICFYATCTLAVASITYFICNLFKLSLVITLIIRAIICCIIPNVLFLLTYLKSPDFKYTFEFLNLHFLKGKLNKFSKFVK